MRLPWWGENHASPQPPPLRGEGQGFLGLTQDSGGLVPALRCQHGPPPPLPPGGQERGA